MLITYLTNSLHNKNAGSTVHLHSVALKLVVCCTLWHYVRILYAMVCFCVVFLVHVWIVTYIQLYIS